MKVKDITGLYNEMKAIALFHGVDHDSACDIVQDVFLKLCEMEKREGSIDRIVWKGKLNMVYIFAMIKNRVIDLSKKDKRFPKAADYKEPSIDPSTLLGKDIDKLLQNEGPFYHKLYTAYFCDKISMRKLAAESDISVSSIFYGVKYIKEKIKEAI